MISSDVIVGVIIPCLQSSDLALLRTANKEFLRCVNKCRRFQKVRIAYTKWKKIEAQEKPKTGRNYAKRYSETVHLRVARIRATCKLAKLGEIDLMPEHSMYSWVLAYINDHWPLRHVKKSQVSSFEEECEAYDEINSVFWGRVRSHRDPSLLKSCAQCIVACGKTIKPEDKQYLLQDPIFAYAMCGVKAVKHIEYFEAAFYRVEDLPKRYLTLKTNDLKRAMVTAADTWNSDVYHLLERLMQERGQYDSDDEDDLFDEDDLDDLDDDYEREAPMHL